MTRRAAKSDALRRQVRDPVRRARAQSNLILMLLSFAGSVFLTRAFLTFTGYPQLGGGGLHIAHVLWGGLLLFAAALLPLMWANQWVYPTGALLTGAGVGLFIDEVGKFITANNDYFFPAAAPIVYAFFLLTVLVYLRVARPRAADARTELYAALGEMEEILDGDLSREERTASSPVCAARRPRRRDPTWPDWRWISAPLSLVAGGRLRSCPAGGGRPYGES